MTVPEMETALEQMVCLIDTREQDTPQLRERMAKMKTVERKKLDFGDYSVKFPLPDGEWLDLSNELAIERKMNIEELTNCFFQHRDRFEREFERSRKANAKVYLLVENATVEKIHTGQYRTKVSPQALRATLWAWTARYNLVPVFCTPKRSGEVIRDILYYEGRERLKAMCNE